MENDMAYRVYENLVCGVWEPYRMPGVEDAFAEGSFCQEMYGQMSDAYERLRERLGVEDEDADAEIMLHAQLEITRELCLKMYRYGAIFGLTPEK